MHKGILSQRVVLLSGESRQSTSQQNFLRGLCGLSKGLWQTHSSMADYERDRKAKAAAKSKPRAKPKAKARGRPPQPKFVQLQLESNDWLWKLFQSIRAQDGTGVGVDRHAA